ncbi:YjzD family protein [Bacillus sp. FJAT-49711]|uniref:YjzD family protein n=1 Tax=Bacillus sp. FJAT-49711 TaxID=2833585 RepID=UPI001BC8F163|nr:YjzD family protein [Bacillus sp. FJAT-49711]MBS4218020.1 YjzD family protein [Bacillus sp. FJAT-49711]
MRYVWGFIWTFLLIHMLTYVAGSMLSVPYDFKTGSILGIGAFILMVIVTAVLPTVTISEEH